MLIINIDSDAFIFKSACSFCFSLLIILRCANTYKSLASKPLKWLKH
jgi:hypothetical protein